MTAKNKNKPLNLVGYILLIEIIGAIGTIATNPAIPTWYAGLNKPFFNPPNWLFGPVWTLLFALLGINLYLLKRSDKSKAKEAVKIFWYQMVLNVTWSFMFFGLKNPFLGLINIVFLLYFILRLYKSSLKVSKTTAYLILPYIAWVSFATILNFSILLLN